MSKIKAGLGCLGCTTAQENAQMKRQQVKIEPTGGTLRLRWWFQGKRYSLSNGDRDNPLGWGMAQQTAAQIRNDCDSGYFDPSLVKYRRRIIAVCRYPKYNE